jgi:AraC family transcriptional regulator
MEPRILTRPALVVVGMTILTKPMSPEIPQLWPRFMGRISELEPLLEPYVSYGVMETPPGVEGGLSYMAAVSVADAAAHVPEGMTLATIPGGQYAVFEFPLSGIAAAFDHVFNTWLPASGFVQARSPLFERYGEDFNPADPSSRMEVHMPIRQAADPA